MPQRLAWNRSLTVKPVAIVFGVAALSVAFAVTNLSLLRSIRGDAAVINEVGRGRALVAEAVALSYRLADETGAEREKTLGELQELIASVNVRFTDLREGNPARHLPRVGARLRPGLKEREDRWRTEIFPVLERLASLTPGEEARPLLAGLVASVAALKENRDADVELAQRIAEDKVDRFRRVQYVFVGLLVVGLVPIFWVARGVARRSSTLAATAGRIAAGELELAAPVAGRDELGTLGQAFNTMTANLRALIEREQQGRADLESLFGVVAETASSLASSTAEILAGTTQQTAGAQEQAAAVAETVATVDEVAQTAEQTAGRAREVAEASQRSVEVGEAGRHAVGEAVAGMGMVTEQVEGIAESVLTLAEQAQAIGEIIAAVNDIAEQTNLLALNASIEAARAGEHGKGFQVVATEVKALADQAKKATAQVRRILGDIQKATNQAVLTTEEGTRSANGAIKVVDQAGQTISMLADTIAQAALTAAQIAASAGQQSAGMSQIRQAMRNVDQAASQNLAATKQAERAAQDLDGLGEKLTELLAGHGR